MDDIESKRLAQQRDLRISYFRCLEETEDGKKVLNDLLSYCGLQDLSYVRGETEQTIFNEGKRSVGIYLLNMLDPSALEASKAQSEAITGPENEKE